MSVYVWGSNKCQQLVGQKGLHCYAPSLVMDQFDGQTPIQIASGDGHTLVLCESGDIYSYGRGKEGQLGHECAEMSTSTSSHSHVVAGLEHETIVKIAAGSLTSYAITSAGEVYHWGLIHHHVHEYKEVEGSDGVNEAVQAGKLTGIAQEQLTTVVEVDTAARASSNNHNRRGGRPAQSRQLRDIVRDSTERWMMPTDDAEQEYYEELRAMGYQNEDVEERMQSRGREYHGMLAMGCSRQIQAIPKLIGRLDNIRIVEVSAGYAHVMLLSDVGQLYGAGYNDRGQLGLGHRINTSEFKHVDFLANKFVVQVICGQQHTLCRAVDKPSASSTSSSSSAEVLPDPLTVFVGSGIGADAYVWGNGVLGQLGIGRRGTSKGRLLPTLLASLHAKYPKGIISVAAGANFSAVVTIDGSVYSFGHAEYNQHGTGNKSYKDYVDPYYYFEPRVMECFDNSTDKGKSSTSTTSWTNSQPTIRMKSLSCGAVFTVGTDDVGNLHSWGWNDSGVLGHGFNHFSSSAMQISAIGKSFDGCKVLSVTAGSKHCMALTQTQGNPWALTFKNLLEIAPYADCTIRVSGTGVSYPCHRSILCCRSKYFEGFIRSAVKDLEENTLYNHLQHQLDSTNNNNEVANDMIQISVNSQYANASTIKSLLEYLYLDRIHIPFHKRRELLHLAIDLNITRLIAALQSDTHIEYNTMHPPNSKLSADEVVEHHTGVPSFFIHDLHHLFNTTTYCDIVFVDGLMPSLSSEALDESVKMFRPEDQCFYLYAHKVIVSRIPYFEAMITGHFSESTNFVSVEDTASGTVRKALCVDVSGLQMDEISLDTFVAVMRYAYTGRLSEFSDDCDGSDPEEVDMGLVMSALVAANRLNFALLTQHCERILSLHIGEYYPHNAENCLSFAVSYNIPRLERQCLKVLKRPLV